MRTQLFISSSILTLSLARASLACGSESPDQVPNPQFSMTESQGHAVLQFHDKTAQTIFEHLADPEVKRFNSDFYQLKIGFGLICVAQPALQNYSCFERFANDGEVQGYFPYADALKNSKSWLLLNLKGPAMQQLYSTLSVSGDIYPNEDGSMAIIKNRTAITCTKLTSLEAVVSYECSQYLSGAGFPMGTGTDPMIGSGTHPVAVDVEEGGHP